MNTETAQLLQWGKTVLDIEAQAVQHTANQLDKTFVEVCRLILASRGRVVISGMGKSGHIGRKIAATLASTGTPAFFVHPAEAAHGDLGMIVEGDVVLLLSNSGQSEELLAILPALKRKNCPLVAITSRPESVLAQQAHWHLTVRVPQEACPHGLAPTSSTTAVLALGDALAVALLQAKSFSKDDFALSHPAGSLGKRLLLTVADVMHTGDTLPVVDLDTPLAQMIVSMSEKGLGLVVVQDASGSLFGIFTDGDLRRLCQKSADFRGLTAQQVCSLQPQTITSDRLAAEALQVMQHKRINGLVVCDAANRPIGALNMHDLLKAGVAI